MNKRPSRCTLENVLCDMCGERAATFVYTQVAREAKGSTPLLAVFCDAHVTARKMQYISPWYEKLENGDPTWEGPFRIPDRLEARHLFLRLTGHSVTMDEVNAENSRFTMKWKKAVAKAKADRECDGCPRHGESEANADDDDDQATCDH